MFGPLQSRAMDSAIILALLQDGIVNGAIYALLGLALVLVFTVTRVIFIPQGEFVAFGAITYALLDAGQIPGTVWLLAGLGAGAAIMGLARRPAGAGSGYVRWLIAETVALPAAAIGAALAVAKLRPGPIVEAMLALALVTPMAPCVWRLAFEPMAEASVLVLLIAAVGVHLVLAGLGLAMFGPEGFRGPGLTDAVVTAGPLVVPGQAIAVLAGAALTMVALALLFGTTLTGKALRAAAVNRLGARLVGIPVAAAGRAAFALAGFIGALSGVLIVPLTTVYYDSGFLIGLKGFVAAIVGGLLVYPAVVIGALFVGVVEAFAAFWSSGFKEAIVFSLVVPVLLWRSWRTRGSDDAA